MKTKHHQATSRFRAHGLWLIMMLLVGTSAVHSQITNRKSQDELVMAIQASIDIMRINEIVHVEKSPRGVSIVIPGKYLFSISSAVLVEISYPIMNMIATIIEMEGRGGYTVAIESHTSNIPPEKGGQRVYATNWELAGARAASVIRYLLARGLPASSMRAVAYSSGIPPGLTWIERQKLISEQGDPDNRETQSRNASESRIEITFLAVY